MNRRPAAPRRPVLVLLLSLRRKLPASAEDALLQAELMPAPAAVPRHESAVGEVALGADHRRCQLKRAMVQRRQPRVGLADHKPLTALGTEGTRQRGQVIAAVRAREFGVFGHGGRPVRLLKAIILDPPVPHQGHRIVALLPTK